MISLSFNDNLLRTIVSSPFSHFKSLEMLFMNNNDITELPKGILNIYNLIFIFYHLIKYTSLSIIDLLRMTQNLRQLNISNNKLSDIDAVVVSHLTALRVLNLDYNQLTKLSAEVMFFTHLYNSKSKKYIRLYFFSII